MTETIETLLPGETLGLLGGGQLGRMFAQAAAQMGYHVLVLEPSNPSPAGEVSCAQIAAAYDDTTALDEMSRAVRAVTTEFENVPATSLEHLARLGVRTAPHADAVAVTQDRNREKAFAESAGVPTAPHAGICAESDWENVTEDLFPGILKTARLGYDGKGQVRVDSKADARKAWEALDRTDCILEKRLNLAKEISVIVCRNQAGSRAVFPVAENHHRNGILAYTVLPARISPEIAKMAQRYAERIVDAFDYVGVLCLEFFVLEDGSIVLNEMAPRPHNSGHATIEACVSSQYDQQVRAMTGLPLGSTALKTPAVMLNLLGDLWFDEAGHYRTPDWAALCSIPGLKLHLYGKEQARHARKMGHATVVGQTLEEALERAKAAAEMLSLPFAGEL